MGWMERLSIIRNKAKDETPVRFGNSTDIWPGGEESYSSYGVPWANLSNTPFRLYKGWIHEGGIATPFIAHWPAGMKVEPGSLHRSPWQLPDVMASLLEIADAPYPSEYDGCDILPIEGRSFASVFSNLEVTRDAPLFWEHEGNAGVRDGSWKLVREFSLNGELPMDDPKAWELYDLSGDRTESEDLSDEMPERVSQLLDAYLEWARRCHVLDYPKVREL